MRVKECMSPNPLVVKRSTTIQEVAKLFHQHHFETFPVVDEGMRLVGIISMIDLLKVFIPEYFDLIDDLVFFKDFGALEVSEMSSQLFLVEDLMTKEVVTIEEDAPILKAMALMKKHRVRSLPVVRDKKVVGIISRRDILTALLIKEGG